jgi:fumarylacetoacetate (FAA) hydrolase family protein
LIKKIGPLSPVLGKKLWKRVAGRYYSERLLNAILNDRYWKRYGD